MELSVILDAIEDGSIDGHFDQVFDAIKARRKLVHARQARTLEVGQLVELVNLRPAYLVGVVAEIVKRPTGRSVKFEVRLKEPVGSFSTDPILVHQNCLKPLA